MASITYAWKEWEANFKVSVSNKDRCTKGATWSMKLETTDFWRAVIIKRTVNLLFFLQYIIDSNYSWGWPFIQSIVWRVPIVPRWLTHTRAQHALPDTQACLASSPILPAIFTGYLPNRGTLQIFIVLMALYIGLRSSVRRGRRGGRLLL